MARPVPVRHELHATHPIDHAPSPAPPRRSRWLVVAALLALGAGVRVSAMFYENISTPDAKVALMAKHILHGENLPVFLYRQSYMGSLNGLHLVPPLFVFGPSILLVRLNAVLWSLLFPLSLYVLARRLYDEATARVTLLLAAVPPFLMTYYSTVAEPHFETNTFGVVLLLVTLSILIARRDTMRARQLGCLGFIAGVACWTNMKTIVVLGPALLLLLVRDPRLPFRREGWLLGAGFVVGNVPAWLFYLTRRDAGSSRQGSAEQALSLAVDTSWEKISDFVSTVLPYPVGSYYFGPFTPGRTAALVLACLLHAVAVVMAGGEAVRALRGAVPGRRAWGLWLLLMVLAFTYGALFASALNVVGDDSRGRYLLPAYIPLLIFLGAAIVRLGRRSRLAAGGVLGFVLAFHVWTNLDYLWPLWPAVRAQQDAAVAQRDAVARYLRARRPEALLVDGGMFSFRWQFLLDGVAVSERRSEGYYPASVAADAAADPAILGPRNNSMEAQLRTLGASPRVIPFGNEALLEDVRVPARAYRLVSRASWRVVGQSDMPPAVADGDLGTAWPSRPLGSADARDLVVDLGAARPVVRVILWPTTRTDLISPLEVAGSRDAVTWQRLGVAPERRGQPAFVAAHRPVFRPRNGWLEVVTPPRPVRYLRVRPLTPDQTDGDLVGELYAYERADRPPAEDIDLPALLRILRARHVTRLLADPVVSARVARATGGAIAIVPANDALDSHSGAPPAWLFARLRLRSTDAALVPAEDADELRERLEATGVPVTTEPVGSHVVVQPTTAMVTAIRCRPANWRLTAKTNEPDGESARYVVEGRLTDTTRIATVRLEHPWVSTRYAVIGEVGVSDDGRNWRRVDSVRPVAEWAWAGRTLFTFSGGMTELALGGVSGRAVRVDVRLPYRGERAITSLCVRPQA